MEPQNPRQESDLNTVQIQVDNNETLDATLKILTAPKEKRRAERPFAYELVYVSDGVRNKGAKIQIRIETQSAKSLSSLHALSFQGLRVSEFKPANRRAREHFHAVTFQE